MPSNLNALTPDELVEKYLDIKELREKVLSECEPFGFSASQLVSRHFENEIEKFYGKKLLKTRVRAIASSNQVGCEHTDNDDYCPVCRDQAVKDANDDRDARVEDSKNE